MYLLGEGNTVNPTRKHLRGGILPMKAWCRMLGVHRRFSPYPKIDVSIWAAGLAADCTAGCR